MRLDGLSHQSSAEALFGSLTGGSLYIYKNDWRTYKYMHLKPYTVAFKHVLYYY